MQKLSFYFTLLCSFTIRYVNTGRRATMMANLMSWMRQPGHNIPVNVNPLLEVGSPLRVLFIAFMMEQVFYLPLHSFYALLISFETKTGPVPKV
jgi:hypothetical protein